MRIKAALTLVSLLELSACASLPSLPVGGYRAIVVSSKPSGVVAACLTQRWRATFKVVTQASNERSSELRVVEGGRVLFEAEIIAQPVGSTIVYTVPYGLAQPIARSYDDAQACAAK